MEFPHMNATIVLRSEPVIPHPQNLSGHGMSIGMCRNLLFDGGAKRPKQWAKASVSKGENERSHHQFLFEENTRKNQKDKAL